MSTKKLTLNPAKSHASSEAKREIEKSMEYSYLLRINKKDMIDYQSLCKLKGTSSPKEIHQFILRELRKADLR